MDTVGYIYILTNDSMPGLVKIGYADDVDQRIKQLSRSTSVAKPFEVYATCEVKSRLADLILHATIDRVNPALRVSNNKEFFTMSAEQAYNFLEAICKFAEAMTGIAPVLVKRTNIDTTTVDKAIKPQQESTKYMQQSGYEPTNKIISKKPKVPFKFSMIGLAPGDEVVYISDPTVKVKIVDDNHVEYKGNKYSLSSLDEVLAKPKHPRQGPLYFSYNGKALTEIRDELENN